MVFSKRKGYRVERKVRLILEKKGWVVVRAGASLGEADLICIRKGKCILLQVKSTKTKRLYYYGYMGSRLEELPFYLVIDFGYGKIRVLPPQQTIDITNGLSLEDFLCKLSK